MASKYLQLEFKTGKFYEYSAEEKDGYEKHKYKDKKGNKKISYRKYYNKGVKGKLDSVSIYVNEKLNNTKFISISVRNKKDDLIYVPVQIYDSRKDVATYAESLISLLPKLEKGDKVKIYGYNFTPKDEKYPRIGIGIEVDGEKLEKAFTYEYTDKDGKHHKGDIPAIEWKEKKDKLTGEKKNVRVRKTVEAKNEFLIDALVKEVERLKYVKDGDSSEKKEEKKSKKKDKKKKKDKSENKEEKPKEKKKDKKSKKDKKEKATSKDGMPF